MRVVLVNSLFTSLYGIALDEWLRLLWSHRFAVDPPYWPRATFMTGMSLLNSIVRLYEDKTFGSKVTDVEIEPPTFILGHWRSGTSHLHTLLALDTQFAYPNVFQVFNPHTFLTTERYSRFLFTAPKTRMMDNMRFNAEVPFEDEFATCGTLRSPYLMWVFPRHGNHYERYLTFRGVPEREVQQWKQALTLFYKKLTWKYSRPLLLKSPPHTARIRLLLEMFPKARFIHICRNPYTVFQSTQRQIGVSLRTMGLQRTDGHAIDDRIIRRYRIIYDAFFEERDLIPDGQFHEVRFEELERNPLREVENIYEGLNVPGFTTVQPALQRYLDSIAHYRKNEYLELPASLRCTIARVWHRSFEEWGYPT